MSRIPPSIPPSPKASSASCSRPSSRAWALNVFTNYLNQVAETEIDFPVVHASAAKAA